MKSNMTLAVGFLAGTNTETAITEAKQLARSLNLAYTTFSFNGVKFSIGQTANVEEAVQQYGKRSSHVISY